MDSALIKQYNPSKKEEQIKSKFFSSGSASKKVNASPNTQKNHTKNERVVYTPERNEKQHTYGGQIQIPDEKVETFLKDMEKEFKSLNESKIVPFSLGRTGFPVIRTSDYGNALKSKCGVTPAHRNSQQ